jgi:tRNA-2-methylthio-N6-dimethylallyladenosine synthase
VPYTRGRERSSSPESVISSISQMIAEHSIKEVLLLGQNVNSYRHERTDFTALVERILAETKIARIRFTSPHPHDFPRRLLELMAAEERFCSQIHLPLQAGSDAVLQRMRRDYSAAEFIDLAAEIRAIVPDAGISSDIIVGFPGESRADFEQTLAVVEKAQFDMAFMFRYSERKGTIAERELPDDIPETEKLSRLEELIRLQTAISAGRNQAEIGKVQAVLVDGFSKRSEMDLAGRSAAGKTCIFPLDPAGNIRPGDLVDVHISAATSATLRGQLNSRVLLPA